MSEDAVKEETLDGWAIQRRRINDNFIIYNSDDEDRILESISEIFSGLPPGCSDIAHAFGQT